MTSETRQQPLSIALTAALAPERVEAPRSEGTEPRAAAAMPVRASRPAPILEARAVTTR